VPSSIMLRLGVQLALCAGLAYAGCTSTNPEAPRTPSAEAPALAPCPDTMLYVDAGTFTVGTTPEGASSPGSKPSHLVTLTSAYCIDRTEVTTSDYASCTAAACNVATVDGAAEGDCVRAATHPRHPRNCVSWFEANAFCEWRGARLPTEAEWEHAARGVQESDYPWGQDWIEVRNLAMDQTIRIPEPVGSFPAGRTPTGLEDMVGNVAEWMLDWYSDYGPEHLVDPQGPASGTATSRVVRGGGFDGLPEYLTATARMGRTPDRRRNYVGFRCVATPR
jgi:formylglycine-generating enzyme required for sulfatase activity